MVDRRPKRSFPSLEPKGGMEHPKGGGENSARASGAQSRKTGSRRKDECDGERGKTGDGREAKEIRLSSNNFGCGTERFQTYRKEEKKELSCEGQNIVVQVLLGPERSQKRETERVD